MPLLSAHRGGAGPGFPENCLETFEHTLRHTFAMLEIDPRMTKDGEIVIHHDATLDRTTTGTGKVIDKSLAELKQLRLKDSEGNATSYQIPTLDETIKWARGKTILVLDQKDVPLATRVEKIREHRAESFVTMIVNSVKDAKTCHELNHDVLMEVMVGNHDKVAQFDEAGVPWSHVFAFVGHDPPTDKTLYEAIHQRGACCMIGTSRNLDTTFAQRVSQESSQMRDDYRQLISLGADLVETDLPSELAALLFQSQSIPADKQKFFHPLSAGEAE